MQPTGVINARKLIKKICNLLDKTDRFNDDKIVFDAHEVTDRSRYHPDLAKQGALGALVELGYMQVQYKRPKCNARGSRFLYTASREQLAQLKQDVLGQSQASEPLLLEKTSEGTLSWP